jgi:hypothetical protein
VSVIFAIPQDSGEVETALFHFRKWNQKLQILKIYRDFPTMALRLSMFKIKSIGHRRIYIHTCTKIDAWNYIVIYL